MTDSWFDLYGIRSIIFILGVEGEHSPEEMLDALGNMVPHKEEAIMTAARQLRQACVPQNAGHCQGDAL